MRGDKIKSVADQRHIVFVYRDFLESDKLDVYERMVFIYLKMYADKEGKAFPSLATLAKVSGISKRKVQQCIESLQSKGVLKVERRQDDSKGYTSNLYSIYDIRELWTTDKNDGDGLDETTNEEIIMIERLRAKGYTVTKEKGLASTTGQSTDVSPKESKNSYTQNNNKTAKKQAKKSGNNFEQREHDDGYYNDLTRQLLGGKEETK